MSDAQWQPIETAWRAHGNRVLVTDGNYVGQGFWHSREEAWLDCDGIVPTHWMALPEPPK